MLMTGGGVLYSSDVWCCRSTMVTQLIEHERIKTTVPKAKEVRRMADKMVTHAKNGACARCSPCAVSRCR